METVNEARDHVFKVGKAKATNGEINIAEMAEELGMGEEAAMDLENMALILDQRSTEWALSRLVRGEFEEASMAQASVIGTAALIGYKLGCSHTAERMTSDPEQ